MNDRETKTFRRLVPFLILTLLVAFGVGVVVGERRGAARLPSLPPEGVRNAELKPTDVDVSILWDAWKLVETSYVDRKDIDRQGLVYGAVRGLVESLGDPYTVFFNPPEAKQFAEDVRGRFEGIGAEIGIRDGALRIIAPLEGSPAQQAGLAPGDVIVKIDDTIAAELTLDQAVQKIRGPKGTTVTLSISRAEEPEPREVRIERAQIVVPNVRWRLIEPDTAYVQIFTFAEQTDTDFRRVATEIQKSSANRIVLDLRSNPGGFLEVAQRVAGWFLEPGTLVVTEDFGNGQQKNEYRADGPSKLQRYPVVVLVNEGSASASEILAGALRDQRGAKLIGKKTFGKGSVQNLQELRDGSTIKVTVAKWLTPSGQNINKAGLEPDIAVERTRDDITANRDPQLDKAIEIIKGE